MKSKAKRWKRRVRGAREGTSCRSNEGKKREVEMDELNMFFRYSQGAPRKSAKAAKAGVKAQIASSRWQTTTLCYAK
nr:hypothetical protein [Tanacetum cinerariifolium]